MYDGLLPSAPSAGSTQIDRALPPEARAWNRVLDLGNLEAGDLLLFRSIEPDRISRAIVDAQRQGGFAQSHAQWTHAAVYLGDGEHICEANFFVPRHRNGIILRSAFEYCDGANAVRARRPKNMTAKQRLKIAIGALNSLGRGYSVRELFRFWRVARSGRGFWDTTTASGPSIKTHALVCSTLYQDALAFAGHGITIGIKPWCTPAHLSSSGDFETPEPTLNWLDIA